MPSEPFEPRSKPLAAVSRYCLPSTVYSTSNSTVYCTFYSTVYSLRCTLAVTHRIELLRHTRSLLMHLLPFADSKLSGRRTAMPNIDWFHISWKTTCFLSEHRQNRRS
ncbi:hypothetical protein PMIN06_010709 [Paraphaeosphaeria minitans]